MLPSAVFTKIKKRSLALLMALCLLLTCTGCGTVDVKPPQTTETPRPAATTPPPTAVPSPSPSPSPEPEPTEPPAPEIWRGDVHFDELEYEHYDFASFEPFVEALRAFADGEGNADDFAACDDACYDELLYIELMSELIDLAQYRDVTDLYAAEESLYMTELLLDAEDAYRTALRDLAASPYADVMRLAYDAAEIADLADYSPLTEEEREWAMEEERLVQDYYLLMSDDAPDLDEAVSIFVELVKLRKQQAAYSGYDSYADYAYAEIFCRDYTPADTGAMEAAVRETFAPFQQAHYLDWSRAINVLFNSDPVATDDIFRTMTRVLPKLSPKLAEAYDYMQQYGLYDVEPAENKAGVGFTMCLNYWNEPYIFLQPDQWLLDYTTMYHEFGHFTNFFFNISDPVFGAADYDLSELQSQGMEMLFSFFYDELLPENAARAMRRFLFLNLADSVVQGAMYDEFQQLVYAEEELTEARVLELYRGLYEAYMGYAYDGCEYEWVAISHNFENPFYYISYGVSALGVIALYRQCAEDWDAGLETALNAIFMDTEAYYYSEALAELGLTDIFDTSVYAELIDVLEQALPGGKS